MDKSDIMLYTYCNEYGEKCVVLDSNKLKMIYGAKEVYLDTEE